MVQRAKVSNTERAYDDLVDEFSNLVEAMEDVFSAAAEDGGEKLSELKDQAEVSIKKAKGPARRVREDRVDQGPQDGLRFRRLCAR